MTAYGALRTAEVKAGETLVVLGATGGVGSAGVQIGKVIGSCVIAIVSTAGKAERLQDLGADHVVALSDGPLAEQIQDLTKRNGADVVLDTVGGDVTGQALSTIASFGRLVHLGYSAGTSLKTTHWILSRSRPRFSGLTSFWFRQSVRRRTSMM